MRGTFIALLLLYVTPITSMGGNLLLNKPRYNNPCSENLDACSTLPECWYSCGNNIKQTGMGSIVPPEPDGYDTFNSAPGRFGTLSGGERNYLSGTLGTISGGKDNTCSGNLSSVGGGKNNKAEGKESVIAGGKNNIAIGIGSVVPGGTCNVAGHKNSMVFGGSESDTGDCISDGAVVCNTDRDGQVRFCNPTSVFEGSVDVGNVSISNNTISGIYTMDITETLIIGVKDDPFGNHTEITKDKIKVPELETDKLQFGDNHTEITKDKIKVPELETDIIKMSQIKTKNVSNIVYTEMTPEKIVSPNIETGKLLIGNVSEITDNMVKTPMIETRVIKLSLHRDGRRLQDEQIYTIIDSSYIITESLIVSTIRVNSLFINGIEINATLNIWLSCCSILLNVILWIFVLYHKKPKIIIEAKKFQPA